MAAERIEIGETGRRIAANLAILRRKRGLTVAEMSRRLNAAGRPIPVLGLRRIEALNRRVDVDDLTALAEVLGMEPARLAYESTCEQCAGSPPQGFSCNECGVRGEAA